MTTRWDVTAIGEGGLRLSTPAGTLLERADSLDLAIAGAELNVMAGLAALEWRTAWASVLPDSAVARRVRREVRTLGVAEDLIVRVDDGRVGVYFVEYGAAPRPTSVHFDRRDTAFANIDASRIDWDGLLDTRILHLTGITAAISPAALGAVQEGARRAREAGVLVSFDVNHRARMWDTNAARAALVPLVDAADIVLIRQGDAELLFGTGEAEASLEEIRRRSSASRIAVTAGADGSIGWANGRVSRAPAVPVEIVDRLGAGDAFAAGYLHGVLSGEPDLALSDAAALAALCLSQHGEQVVATRSDLRRITDNRGSGLDR